MPPHVRVQPNVLASACSRVSTTMHGRRHKYDHTTQAHFSPTPGNVDTSSSMDAVVRVASTRGTRVATNTFAALDASPSGSNVSRTCRALKVAQLPGRAAKLTKARKTPT